MATLVIGGFDPSGGAGVTADLEVLRDYSAPPLAIITAITAQNAARYVDTQAVRPSLLNAQIEAVFEHHDINACKVGMMGSLACAEIILSAMTRHPHVCWIIDPVISSTSGGLLMPSDVRELLMDELFPRCSVLTPNLDEAQQLFQTSFVDVDDLERFGASYSTPSNPALLLKGGHLDGAPVDVLAHAGAVTRFESPTRYPSARGTGCRLSTAIAIHRSRGTDLVASVRAARDYVADYLMAQRKTK